MGATRERPLLHEANVRFRRNLVAVAIGLAIVALSLVWVETRFGTVSGVTDKDTYKLLLQFFLITAGGGAFLAIVGNAQAVAARRQETAASVQALDRELDSAYRALKKVKRRLRGHSRYESVDGKAASGPGPGVRRTIERGVFERSMDDLLDAQLRLETICDRIGQRDDILQPGRLERMRGPLGYASRYYHDLHEDFEKGRASLSGDRYVLADAFNLNDYLCSSHDRHELAKARPGKVNVELKRLEDDKLKPAVRAQALADLVAASPGKPADSPSAREDKVRYSDVAAACFDLLSAELAQVRTKLLS